jgi:glycosyltransferase involved in cell wall biosynthesis
MPVYNEAKTLRRIVARVLASPVPLEIELVCVDDCSSDKSFEILTELAAADARIKPFRQAVNGGKGAAIQAAVARMTGDIAIVQDADLEYDPRDYPAMLAPILQGNADAVFGSRFAYSAQRRLLFFWHAVANRVLTLMTNALNDLNMSDMETCYKAVRADILRQIPLNSKRFGIEPELTTRLAQMNVRIYEVPISYHGRTVAEGKKIGLKDAFEAVWCLFKYKFIDTRFTMHDAYYVMESFRRARGFNRWTLRQFGPYLGSRVLEAGCGIGNFTELLLDRERLVCTDEDPFFIEMIGRRFGHLENISVRASDPARAESYADLRDERLDTIICCNVLEHVECDQQVLSHYFDLLGPGGHALVLVPAHHRLYSKCDENLGHRRRYSPEQVRLKMEAAGFKVVMLKQFNRLGVLGWWVNKLRGRQTLSPRDMKAFEKLLPIAKLLEAVSPLPGLSVLAVGEKARERKE